MLTLQQLLVSIERLRLLRHRLVATAPTMDDSPCERTCPERQASQFDGAKEGE